MGKKTNKTNYNDVVVTVVDDDNDDDEKNYFKGFLKLKKLFNLESSSRLLAFLFCLVKKHKRPNTKLTNKQKRTIFFCLFIVKSTL